LQKAGHRVIAVQLPEHSLADDVTTVKRAIQLIGRPTVLVGHSYGGEVITNAAYNNPNVKGLVYVAAFAPNEGQSLGSFVDVKKLPKDLLITDSGGFAYINPTAFARAFAQDVNSTEADIMAVVQKPFNTSILGENLALLHESNFQRGIKSLRTTEPSLLFSNVCSQNRLMLLLSHSPSGHLSLVTHPDQIAQLILNATKGIRK